MHTLKLEVEDSVIDKVKLLLKQLPKNKVRIQEEIINDNKSPRLNSISLHTKGFKFDRNEANAR